MRAERPEALTVRARSSSEVCSSMSSAVPPASSASSRARCPWGRRMTASARALLAPLRTLDASDRRPRSMPRGSDDHGFTCAGFAGQHGESGFEGEPRIGDDAEVSNMDFLNHERSFLFLVLLGILRAAPATDRKLKFTHQSLREGSRVNTGEQHRLFGASHLNTGAGVQLYGSAAIAPEHAGGTVSGASFLPPGWRSALLPAGARRAREPRAAP